MMYNKSSETTSCKNALGGSKIEKKKKMGGRNSTLNVASLLRLVRFGEKRLPRPAKSNQITSSD